MKKRLNLTANDVNPECGLAASVGIGSGNKSDPLSIFKFFGFFSGHLR
jgi:hypothetical protein